MEHSEFSRLQVEINACEYLFDREATIELRKHPDRLRLLIKIQANETYEFPRPKKNTGLFFQFITTRLAQLPPGFLSNIYGKLMDNLYPQGCFFGWTIDDEFNWAWNEAQQLLEENKFALTKLNGEIISIAAYKTGGQLEDGRTVFELTKFVTLPRYRGQGIYRLLRTKLVQRIKERHTDSPLMTLTKNGTVIHQCLTLKWEPISLNTYSEISRRSGRCGLTPEDIQALQHWRGFLYDPLP